MSAAGRLIGKYTDDTDAVKKLTEQIRSWDERAEERASRSGQSKENLMEGLNGGGGGGRGPTTPSSFSAPQPMGRPAAAVAGAVGGVLGAVANYGATHMGSLLAENAMTTQASYMGGRNPQAEIAQIVGSGGGGYNNVANSTQDAMQQLSILQNLTGSAMVNQTSQGRAAMGASFAGGYLNPGMSGAQASTLAASIYAPQTSQYMSQFGLSPMQYSRSAGGKPRAVPIGTFADSLLYKMMGGRAVNNKQLANFMKVGGPGQAEYNFLTGGQIPLQQMLPIMEATNQLQRSGASEAKSNWALTQAGHGNKNAIKFLQQHGVAESDITGMKAAMAPNMARTGDQYSGMQQGLQAATAAVTAFNTQFSKWMKLTGLDNPTGFAEGALGSTNALEPDLFKHGAGGSGIGGIAGTMGKFMLLRRLFGAGRGFLGDIFKKVGGIGDFLKKIPGLGKLFDMGGDAGALKFLGPAGMGVQAFLGLGQILTGKNSPLYQWMNATIGKIPGLGKPLRTAEGWSTDAYKGTIRDVVNPVAHAAGSAFHHVTNFLGGLFGGGKSGPNIPATGGKGGKSSNTISGTQIVDYAKQFVGHPYVLGGSGDYQTSRKPPYGPWDCAGFVTQMYAHFGLSGWSSVNVSGLTGWGKITDPHPVVGGFVTYVTDGSVAAPGHVGLITGPNSTIQAMDPALGTRTSDLGGLGHAGSGGPVHYYAPPHGFTGGSAGGGSGGSSFTDPVPMNATAGSSFGTTLGTGDTATEGSTAETAAFMSAIQGGITGGSGYTGQNLGTYMMVSGGSGNGGSGGGGNGSIAGYSNPIPNGATPERIDQGVDFGGSGPIKAIGDATIIMTNGGGWPGGPFMSYRLKSGAAAGKTVYVAENIRPTVRAGQQVTAGQTIAMMFNGGTGIETGWANASGSGPLSQDPSAGGIGGGNLPGGGSIGTAVGVNFDRLLVALGAPAAPNLGKGQGGKLPGGYPDWSNLGGSGGKASKKKHHDIGGDIEVHHAHKTVKMTVPSYTYSTLHPVYAGGNDLLPDVPIDLHFRKKAVKFVFPAAIDTDTGASTKAQTEKIKTAVAEHKLRAKILKGVK